MVHRELRFGPEVLSLGLNAPASESQTLIEPRTFATALAVFVFGWQLWGAGRTFRLPGGERPALRHYVVPVFFVLILVRSLSLPLRPALLWPGSIGLAAALILFEWSRRSIRGRYFSFVFSQDAPEFLWTRGPFAYVRNPFYSSYLLAGLSVALMFFDYSTLVCQGLLLASARAAARGEERKFLLSRLAGEYRAYASRTGRFLPRVGRLRSL